ncbi:hypothetical protein ABEB36_004717 [Hypothenemus hampei]
MNCDTCLGSLKSDNLDPCNAFIAAKEFSDNSQKLYYPSEELVISVGQCVLIIEEVLKDNIEKTGLMDIINFQAKAQVDFGFLEHCSHHSTYLKDVIIQSVCKIGIPWFCNRQNRDMRAERKVKLSSRKYKKLLHQ